MFNKQLYDMIRLGLSARDEAFLLSIDHYLEGRPMEFKDATGVWKNVAEEHCWSSDNTYRIKNTIVSCYLVFDKENRKVVGCFEQESQAAKFRQENVSKCGYFQVVYNWSSREIL